MAIFQACTLLGHVGIFTYDLDACEYAVMKGFTWRVVRIFPSGIISYPNRNKEGSEVS